jgi:hypothetical protein
MRDLENSPGLEEIEREESRLADDLTIEQSARLFLSLYNAMSPMLKETEDLFRSEREAYLVELQTRLRRLDDWLRQQHGSTYGPF